MNGYLVMNNCLNIYQIRNAQGTWSKTLDESRYSEWNDYFDDVEKQRFKLSYGLFQTPDKKFYFAKWKKVDLSVKEEDEATHTTMTIQRIIKFKWTYQELK